MTTDSVSAPAIVKKSLNWSITLSVLLILAGLLAIVMPPVAGFAVTIFVGWLLVFSGVMHFVYAWHTRGTGAIIWEILLGIAYGVVGGYMLYHPLLGMASITLALAAYLFAECILEFILGFALRGRSATAWLFLDGIITLILAVMIFFTWPSSTGWVLGTLVGISMLFSGFTRLMISLAARKVIAQTF
jgi:uncharacterized membrane protein HdeD (DUF308 family)